MENGLVPALDAAGMPGPPWLFHMLLVFTFFLHMVFMNLTLGGTILAWVAHLRARDRADDPGRVLAGRLMAVNTYAISLAITTGVAPLLFIQVLYQQYFYAGTILLGWIWFSFLGVLIAGYYAVYLYKFRGAPRHGSGGGLWLGIAAVSFLLIAMVHVAVHLIHIEPARWEGFAANPSAVLGDPTFWPRLLHFVLAGIAFSALVICWWASRGAAAGDEVEVNLAIARSCWKWALWTTALQIVDGFILLFALPQEILIGIMRGSAATLGPLTLSILLGIGLLVLLARRVVPVASHGLVTAALGTMAIVVAVMSVTRHQVRVLYLEPVTDLYEAIVVPQWGNFYLFVALLIAALGTVAYITWRAISDPASGDEAA